MRLFGPVDGYYSQRYQRIRELSSMVFLWLLIEINRDLVNPLLDG